jgi:hypothetical protein
MYPNGRPLEEEEEEDILLTVFNILKNKDKLQSAVLHDGRPVTETNAQCRK